MLEYPMGPYNEGGGGTGICRLGETLFWGDQTTGSVHSADLSLANGTLTKHNAAFIGNLTDPQGVACDAKQNLVYVIDAIPGGGGRGVFFRSPEPGSPTRQLAMIGGAFRSIKIIDGNLWFGSDSGIFRSMQQKPGTLTLAQVVNDGKIYEDFEVIDVLGKTPIIFASTYDWSGIGVLESELNHQHQNLTRPFRPMKGGACDKGSELVWGLAADASAKILYWVVADDAEVTHMKVMYKSYESNDPARVAYSAIGSAYGIYFDPEQARTLVV